MASAQPRPGPGSIRQTNNPAYGPEPVFETGFETGLVTGIETGPASHPQSSASPFKSSPFNESIAAPIANPLSGPLAEPFPDRLIRRHRSASHRLSLRTLYILPSGFGWLWLLSCGVLFILGVQGSSQGALLLAYLGLGLFLLAPYLTQFNLQGLELRCGSPAPGFAGDVLPYPVQATSRDQRLALGARFRRCEADLGWSGCLEPGQQWLAVPWRPSQRGLQRPGRLRLQSSAPLGLFVCWTLWDPPAPQLIYPARRPGPVLELDRPQTRERHQAEAGDDDRAGGSDHWRELTPHRPEEGLARLAWKQLARSGERYGKRFADPQPRPHLLAPDPALPREQALEHLSARIWQLAASGESYGLVLASQTIPAGAGSAQLERCLTALALAPP
jgi:uncharacterized protein (DUF58 family)